MSESTLGDGQLELTLESADYPALYVAADSASLAAQRTYLLLRRFQLGLLVAASVAAIISARQTGDARGGWYTATAVLLSIGMTLLWIIRARRDERAWFDGRAIAESSKSLMWRFVTRTLPFAENATADAEFVGNLREARQARNDVANRLARQSRPGGQEITEAMRRLRAASLEDRRQVFIEKRLRDQRDWYSRKAADNSQTAEWWFWISAVLQLLAIIAAIVGTSTSGTTASIIPIVTTLIAVAAAWTQVKRFDELAQAYALAAQELCELDALSSRVRTESEFCQLVEQVEETISREHTMWCARRDVDLRHPH